MGDDGALEGLGSPSSGRCGNSALSERRRSSTGKPRARHPSKPPLSGRTLSMPRFFNLSATLALVASLGQVQ